MPEKIYAPGSAKLREKCNWFELGYSFKADQMIEFIRANTNSRGYVNLRFNERRQLGKYGETHTVSLNDYEPQEKSPQPQARNTPPAAPQSVPSPQSDDVPF